MFITLLGFITGTLIGLTGTGGGVILTPLLLIFTPFPAVVIIGTDIVNGAVTKLVGVIEHRRLGQIHWRLAGLLISGSVPGTLAGILFVSFLKANLAPGQLDHVLKTVLAITLFGVSIFLPFVRGGQIRIPRASLELASRGEAVKLVAVGAAVGFMVAVTSIGSGSLLMIFLLLLIPLPLGALVGTDIAFGLATMALAGALHLGMGHFNAGLFLRLAAGALPGVVLGSRLTRLIPERYFSWLFSILYFSLGARLLVG
ncbi:MAG: sulfite exporter TauE/SafE family protein [Acidobacteria bacterium]|nr:sulfite exporter TauE/SafE family protein [Acidobacteriota bacterium]